MMLIVHVALLFTVLNNLAYVKADGPVLPNVPLNSIIRSQVSDPVFSKIPDPIITDAPVIENSPVSSATASIIETSPATVASQPTPTPAVTGTLVNSSVPSATSTGVSQSATPVAPVQTVYVTQWPQDQWIPPNVVVAVNNTPINKPSNAPQAPPTVFLQNPFGGSASVSINWLVVIFAILGPVFALVLI